MVKLRLERMRIGMRTIKTAVAVLLCMLIFPFLEFLAGYVPTDGAPLFRAIHFLLHRDSPIFACVASIIVMQSTVESSLRLGTSRIKGTIFGGLFGLGFLYLDTLVPSHALNIFLVTVGVVIIICFFNLIDSPQSTAIGLVTFLIIMIAQTNDDPFLYAINRIIDTSIGVVVSVGVNFALGGARRRIKRQSGGENSVGNGNAQADKK